MTELVVAVLAYDGIEPIDIGATYGVLSMATRVAPGLSMHVAAPRREVRMAQGLGLLADHALAEAPPADVAILLGGPGWSAAAEGAALLDDLRRRHAAGQVLAAVCTGGMILAAAGLLDGRRATTKREIVAGEARPLDLLATRPGVEAVEARVVDAGDVVTGGGVSLGHDLTLHLLRRFLGPAVADETARILEYDRALAANAAALPDLVT